MNAGPDGPLAIRFVIIRLQISFILILAKNLNVNFSSHADLLLQYNYNYDILWYYDRKIIPNF